MESCPFLSTPKASSLKRRCHIRPYSLSSSLPCTLRPTWLLSASLSSHSATIAGFLSICPFHVRTNSSAPPSFPLRNDHTLLPAAPSLSSALITAIFHASLRCHSKGHSIVTQQNSVWVNLHVILPIFLKCHIKIQTATYFLQR